MPARALIAALVLAAAPSRASAQELAPPTNAPYKFLSPQHVQAVRLACDSIEPDPGRLREREREFRRLVAYLDGIEREREAAYDSAGRTVTARFPSATALVASRAFALDVERYLGLERAKAREVLLADCRQFADIVSIITGPPKP